MRDEELASVIDEVRIRVRARYPEQALENIHDNELTNASDPGLPCLLPLLHARDAAEAKVAAIGTVNPRLPGVRNTIIQWVKRKIARGLDWHVREQVVFNRAALDCVQAALEALTEANRALDALKSNAERAREQREKSDIVVLQTIAEMEALLQHRTTELDRGFRAFSREQHAAFAESLAQSVEAMRNETERLIHSELRLIRQRTKAFSASQGAVDAGASAPFGRGSAPEYAVHPERAACGAPQIDWLKFADVFRGPEEQIRERHRRHTPLFAGCVDVLDIGCGRGEFLEAAREGGIAARGIDRNAECVALCRSKNLTAETADLFTYLESVEDKSLAGVFCAHVVEHLDPLQLPNLIALLSRKMRRTGVIVIETPNPEDAGTMARHFWIDPTHTRPVPVTLLRFYFEEAGFGGIAIEMGADYAISARKLAR